MKGGLLQRTHELLAASEPSLADSLNALQPTGSPQSSTPTGEPVNPKAAWKLSCSCCSQRGNEGSPTGYTGFERLRQAAEAAVQGGGFFGAPQQHQDVPM